MGCGCKNKGNQAQPSPEQQAVQQEALQQSAVQRNATLKESIKKICLIYNISIISLTILYISSTPYVFYQSHHHHSVMRFYETEPLDCIHTAPHHVDT